MQNSEQVDNTAGLQGHSFSLDYYILGDFNELVERKPKKTAFRCVNIARHIVSENPMELRSATNVLVLDFLSTTLTSPLELITPIKHLKPFKQLF